jgi:hypothetical protein
MVVLRHTTFFLLYSALCTTAHSIASLLVPHEHLVIAESFQLRVAIWRLGIPVPKSAPSVGALIHDNPFIPLQPP